MTTYINQKVGRTGRKPMSEKKKLIRGSMFLRPDQVEWLIQLTNERNESLSQVLRWVIDRFHDRGIEEEI